MKKQIVVLALLFVLLIFFVITKITTINKVESKGDYYRSPTETKATTTITQFNTTSEVLLYQMINFLPMFIGFMIVISIITTMFGGLGRNRF